MADTNGEPTPRIDAPVHVEISSSNSVDRQVSYCFLTLIF
jgi:hypothetical protein